MNNTKKPIITIKLIMVFLGIFLLLLVFVAVRVYLYVQASQLKITEDVHVSDSILIQEDFGIDLPPGVEITRFGYCEDLVIFRIEGVTDLEAFLIDSLHLDLNAEEAQNLSKEINYMGSQRGDMYGEKRHYTGFRLSKYRSNQTHDNAEVDFFLIDGKIVVEISETYFVTENRARYREIVNR
ncbi:MAG: hypothetical protein PHF65_06015 [Oscillospiraceae bacterium]|nr:hypothetical protein [Oscillospiraceae bacterium]